MSSNKEPDAWMWYCGGFQRAFTDDKEKVETLVQNGWAVEPLYRDRDGKIAAQQKILTDLAEILGVEAGDVDGLISEVERLKKDAERYQFIRERGGISWSRSNGDPNIMGVRATDELYDTLIDDRILQAEMDKALAAGEAGKEFVNVTHWKPSTAAPKEQSDE